MSTLTIMDLEVAFDMLAALLGESPAAKGRSEAELARERQEERRKSEEHLREMEHRDEERYKEQIHALEERKKQYRTATLARQQELVAAQNRELEDMKHVAEQILRDASSAGSSFLSEYANLVYRRDEFEALARDRHRITSAASAIMNEAEDMRTQDAPDRADLLAKRVRDLAAAWAALQGSLSRAVQDDLQAADRAQKYAQWLKTLDEGLEAMQRRIAIFPPVPEDEAAVRAQAITTALENIQYYLYSPHSFYLTAQQKRDVQRIYGLAANTDVSDLPMEDALERNLRFEASHRRILDRQIFDMRHRLRTALERYRQLRARLGDAAAHDDELQPDAFDSAEALFSALNERIRQMEQPFERQVRTEVVQAVVDRAIRSAKRGMAVRCLDETTTAGGSWIAMYQLGQTGTTLEVFADGRGQITLEAGGLLENENAQPTEAQKKSIERNNEHFCSEQLPAILERISEEFAAAGETGTVRVRELAGPEDVRILHTNGARGVVLREDGTAAAAGTAKSAIAERRHDKEASL